MQMIDDFTAMDIILIISNGEPSFFDRSEYVEFLDKINLHIEARELEMLNEEDFDYLLLEYSKEKRSLKLQ